MNNCDAEEVIKHTHTLLVYFKCTGPVEQMSELHAQTTCIRISTVPDKYVDPQPQSRLTQSESAWGGRAHDLVYSNKHFRRF